DKENLKQINLCLLFGEESGLPVFSVEYNGSLNDVKTFHTIIAQLDILKNSKYKLVLDKGFYSTNNIDYMISKVISFLIAVPVKSNYVKSIIEENYNLEDDFNSSFIIGDDIMFCTTNYIKLDNKKLYGHLFLNLNTKNSNKSIIIRKANQMLEEATMNQNKYINDSAYKNVLSFKKSFKSLTGYYVKIKSNLLTNMGHESYLFLLSDVISDPKIALTIY
ncbi:MAG: transposase, partial [Deltaproteobacteria bacterium]|nr:transposase [Deltaproteobacteria bacterium]